MRSTTFGFAASPGAAMPVRSPLMSAMNTGTPAFDSWPAISWRVFVLPVPVAPATSPWRFSMLSATATWGCATSSPSCMAPPIVIDGSASV